MMVASPCPVAPLDFSQAFSGVLQLPLETGEDLYSSPRLLPGTYLSPFVYVGLRPRPSMFLALFPGSSWSGLACPGHS